MKKHKRVRRRPKPRAYAAKAALSSGRTRRARLRQIGWLGGLGVVLLIGFFVFQKRRLPIASRPAPDRHTNSPGPALLDPRAGIGGLETFPGSTNRPGAVLSRDKEGRADDLNNQGTRSLDAGDPKQAIPIFQQALALTPDNEAIHFNLGVAFTKAGDLTSAEHEYKEALRLVPDYPEAHNNYGNLLGRLGRLTEAEAELTEAVNDMPESAQHNNSLGVVLQRLNKTNEALLSFQKAVQCDTNFLEAHFNLAQSYLARKEREKGIAELRQALRIKPGFEPALRAMSRATSLP
jgi:Tfp pilus assembly protein PilF